jgi:hypothetical protein
LVLLQFVPLDIPKIETLTDLRDFEIGV